ncbi:Imm6 family immunity protein [Thermoflavimicrobium dichotomicum]|uniref:Immunity protein Imm6 n=1 Tax=Thermoflavimicrobium dichotomicum TaxID=46223 RepID=A0A1I3T2V1_9BACL|nr:Imm6 family immunity protein [Thermoflavimicrobium dichotomicum]SFJ64842.1 Immunity protein Imm6 [Thermoflavimicrobium dichotomicum]
MEWYQNVNADAKVAYLLTLTEKIMDKIENYEWYHLVRKMMDMCWEWVEEKKHSGDELHERFDDEDDGLILIEGYDEIEENSQAEFVLFCIIDAVCYAIWQAYQYEKSDYIPQYLEMESDQSIDQFMEKIRKVDGYQEEWTEHLKQYLLELYSPASSDKKIKKDEILSQI